MLLLKGPVEHVPAANSCLNGPLRQGKEKNPPPQELMQHISKSLYTLKQKCSTSPSLFSWFSSLVQRVQQLLINKFDLEIKDTQCTVNHGSPRKCSCFLKTTFQYLQSVVIYNTGYKQQYRKSYLGYMMTSTNYRVLWESNRLLLTYFSFQFIWGQKQQQQQHHCVL